MSLLHNKVPLLCTLAAALLWLGGCKIDVVSSFRRLDVGPMQSSDAFQPVILSGGAGVAIRHGGADRQFRSPDDELVVYPLNPLGRLSLPVHIPVPYLSAGTVSRPVGVDADTVIVPVATDAPQATAIAITTVIDRRLYRVRINNSFFSFTSGTSATADEISLGLANAINGGSEPVTAVDLVGSLALVSALPGVPFTLEILPVVGGPFMELLTTKVVNVGILQDGGTYTITLNGIGFMATGGTPAMADQISFDLTTAINAGIEPATAVDLIGAVLLVSDAAGVNFTTTVTSNLALIDSRAAFGDGDDSLAIVSGATSTSPTVSLFRVGPLTENAASRPVPIDTGAVIFSLGHGTGCGTTLNASFGTDDDALMVVSGLPASPVASAPVCVPNLGSGDISRAVVLDPTGTPLALVGSAGLADSDFSDATDLVFLIPNLRAGPAAPVMLSPGPLDPSRASVAAPLALTPDVRALVSTGGSNGNLGDTDDRVALLYDLGGANGVCRLDAPVLGTGERGQAEVASESTALVSSGGLDATFGTTDDRVTLLSALDTAAGSIGVNGSGTCTGGPASESLLVPGLSQGQSVRATAISANQALIATAGANGVMGTPDDVFRLLSALDNPPCGADPSCNADTTLSFVPLSPIQARVQLFPNSPLKVFFRGADQPDSATSLPSARFHSVLDPLGMPTITTVDIPDLLNVGVLPIPVTDRMVIGVGPGEDEVWTTEDDGLVVFDL